MITTKEGFKKIKNLLLTDVENQQDKFYEFCRDFYIDPTKISFNEKQIIVLQGIDQKDLNDIHTEAENIANGNQICEIVQRLAQDHKELISIFKTYNQFMSYLLYYGKTIEVNGKTDLLKC